MRTSHIILVFVSLSVLLAIGQGCAVNPLEAVRLNQLAQIYIKHGDYDSAQELLLKSVDIDYENSASHYWLGSCYEAKNQSEKALQEYRLAVRFDPMLEIAQLALIQAYQQNGQPDQSLEATNAFLKYQKGRAGDLMRLAEHFLQQQMPQQAILAYQAAAKAEERNPQPLLALADYYFNNGQKDLGVDYLTRAFMVDPVYPGLAKRLGEYGMRVEIPQPKLFEKPSPLQKDISELYH